MFNYFAKQKLKDMSALLNKAYDTAEMWQRKYLIMYKEVRTLQRCYNSTRARNKRLVQENRKMRKQLQDAGLLERHDGIKIVPPTLQVVAASHE